MKNNSISTNILRDESKDLNYVVTPNAIQIYNRIFKTSSSSNKSFTLIGNYGTGKSTFLWALEKNLQRQKLYFSSDANFEDKEYEFIKLIGENNSLGNSLSKLLSSKTLSASEIIVELESRRKKAAKKNKGVVLIIDEFGKFLEYINKTNDADDLYLLQQISEWANDDEKEAYFIISLHQSFVSYGSSLDVSDKLEWEKIKGRFVELLFNEPIEQLLFFASKKLEAHVLPNKNFNRFNQLNKLIKNNNLVNYSEKTNSDLAQKLYPLDWLSANILVQALQRYGQNERSLFTFLDDNSDFSISKFKGDFYSIANVYTYLTNTLGSEIYSLSNPHRSQWQTCFRALERAELIKDIDYNLLAEIIKTICLTAIFTKPSSLLNEEVVAKYIHYTSEFHIDEVDAAISKLKAAGVLRFYNHSNKLNFLEGTDIDIEQELADATKEINPDFSLKDAISELVDFPIILVKENSFENGTPRFFEFKILNDLSDVSIAEGAVDGYINLIFDSKISEKSIKKVSSSAGSNLFVSYKNSKEIYNEIFSINKLRHLIEKHAEDLKARKLLINDLEFHKQQLKKKVLNNLFLSDQQNVWLYNGKKQNIDSKKTLNKTLSRICENEFSSSPVFKNELVNKEFLSTQISSARKSFVRHLLNNESQQDVGFPSEKFPPEKSIYITLVRENGIHKKNSTAKKFCYNKPDTPSFFPLWDECESFLKSANSSKRNLGELYDVLTKAPFKLKRGFIDFWIPLFLIIKREDFALFHETNGFVPFLSEDVFDLIHKSPTNYSIKSYDVTGLKINVLESYKELVQASSDEQGTSSTFLSIFGNFLRFYRGLNGYAINTKKISPKAIRLREAIKNAKDPEDALFNQFPSALEFHSISISDDEEILKSYTAHVEQAIREIRTAFDDLIDRVEQKIIDSFVCESKDFKEYKKEINSRLTSINRSLLGAQQSVFYTRLISPLDDRASWIKSVADAALGKSIDKMIDEEELLLNTNLQHYLISLIRASDLHVFSNKENTKMISIELIGTSGNIINDKIIISNERHKDFDVLKSELQNRLGILDVHKRKQLLMELLSRELNEEIEL